MADLLKDRDVGMEADDTSVFCRRFDSLADLRMAFGEFVIPSTSAKGMAEVPVEDETQIDELLSAVAAFQAGDLPDVQIGFDANEVSLSKVSQSTSMSTISVETPTTSAIFKRNVIVETAKGRYRLLSVYVKSYNTGRVEMSASATKTTMIYVCGVEWDTFQY
ncbi:hypothetical protein SPRG_16746 [Saprolegnia parasitica CBS 223.65]|uniref:Uncharacterized protein n=1 Tax=Saprolegnia parasitica (strain CBS 223.65) TaxID=695850 RepID=A0A067BH52_SAPPC|nr:hypothetical protein SPRG_16746 [Saprolegnia parasitica CBS 223.65]KDO17508.1 hypothetical protein SPRG_16746 [Saprolegnia parasitica CBS 223.65]|eukprot:XP_012211782.1 hypothetical protein SPRG_16746 [Saprolegnia parasitica CBS 223.65]